MFCKYQTEPDKFADNLKIPTNIQIDNPIDISTKYKKKPERRIYRKIEKTELMLYNDFQPGMYKYLFWSNKIEKGTIYLKAYEITQNYKLSEYDLRKKSTVDIFNPTDSIMCFESKSHFTIYEGDWDKPYAARFEVWYMPDNGGQERKLLEKNFKIEGWQR